MRDPAKKYLMPVGFGAAAGPRQRPDGIAIPDRATEMRRLSVRFLSDADAIQSLLPDGLRIWGSPIVTLDYTELRSVSWLAGRGYNTFGVRVPAAFEGRKDQVRGQFLAVLWENLTDPIITGREQLGYPKIFANIPDARRLGDTYNISADWLGFRFVDVKLTATRELKQEEHECFRQRAQYGDGLIQHKYLPHTGAPWTESAADYFTFSEVVTQRNRERKPPAPVIQIGSGSAMFLRPQWEDMPTQFHIVQALAALPSVEWLEASLITSLDYSDYNDQRSLR